jgi:Fe-S cluster assembly protein SufD
LSRELYKGVLEGESKGVFLGKISVRQDAQKTDAFQTNKNLILSEKALAHTTPQLEIRANDVRCSHGATIGKLDEEAMFYLRSRGMEILEARTLLVEAFAHEITDRISAAGVRNHLDRILKERFG